MRISRVHRNYIISQSIIQINQGRTIPNEIDEQSKINADKRDDDELTEEKPSRDELFELYKIAVETDRFELDLGWKLVQFFTILNSGLFTAGITLLGSNQIPVKWIISLIFIIGIILSVISILARRSYHKHSLTASYKKILIEQKLGLYNTIKVSGSNYAKHNFAISTSANFLPDPDIFKNPEQYIKKRIFKRGTVPYYHKFIFEMFVVLNIIGILLSTYDLWKPIVSPLTHF